MQKAILIGWSEYDYVSYKDNKRRMGQTLYFVYSDVSGVNGKSCEAITNSFDFDKKTYKYGLDVNQLSVGAEYEFNYEQRGFGKDVSSVLASISKAVKH